MTGSDTLWFVITMESTLLLVAVLLLVGHGLWLWSSARRKARQTRRARETIIPILAAATGDDGAGSDPVAHAAAVEVLRHLDAGVVAAVFLELSRDVSGAGNNVLRSLATDAGLLTRAARMCHSRRWTRRLEGARLLSQLGGPDPVVHTLLHDGNPAVRTQAVEWAASRATPALVDDIVALLASPDLHSRFAVQDALLRIGNPAIEPLVRYLAVHTGAAARSGLELARAMPESRFLPCAVEGLSSEFSDVRASAAGLLGLIGGSDGASRLVDLLADEDADVRAEAARALGRMRHWPASARLALALEDTSWDVRYAAAEALRAMGAPGVLQLRRLRTSPDRFASEMAKLMLGIPETAS